VAVVNLPFSNLFIGTKDHLILGNHFPQIFLIICLFFLFFIWIFNYDCGINLVSLLIFEEKSEQFHALFCIGLEQSEQLRTSFFLGFCSEKREYGFYLCSMPQDCLGYCWYGI
jgi:hypothetical protein